ncbi:MAG: DUF3179 domain-containing (seleno)protein [Chloroflexi bacterium]|nr:DUF3179 domain-containing (seleno)protein [Chloroflexota bacterium]MDA1002700.1 DUF3179 domain-containing (seleno)protein [Chloroflexota bacterium]
MKSLIRASALSCALLLAVACSGAADAPAQTATATHALVPNPPPAPPHRAGPLGTTVEADLDVLMASLPDNVALGTIARLGDSGDARIAWLFADLLRFYPPGHDVTEAVRAALRTLVGVEFRTDAWVPVTNQLISWDLPAPPGYVTWKRVPFELVEPGWAPFFDDPQSLFDYRFLSWGGVRIDDRPLDLAEQGAPCLRGCIPALDHPAVTDAGHGDWYPDGGIVFGVVVNGEARAYPKHIMEVHEMVNDSLGGRAIGVPYCTLCASAQAYFTDQPPAGQQRIELRTSGLLSRSNKVMFDLHTRSAFDTFSGAAVSGPLREAGFVLEQVSVVTSTWGEWKRAHPETTIVSRDGGIGRSYPDDPLRGRDDFGPIFPIGPVDARLPAQALVLGVELDANDRVAFPVGAARDALRAGRPVAIAGVTVIGDAAGLRAFDGQGAELVSHQAFWFAWSQFWPQTLLWLEPLGGGAR